MYLDDLYPMQMAADFPKGAKHSGDTGYTDFGYDLAKCLA